MIYLRFGDSIYYRAGIVLDDSVVIQEKNGQKTVSRGHDAKNVSRTPGNGSHKTFERWQLI